MPDADIRLLLLRPHVHMRMHGGSATVNGDRVVWSLPTPRDGDNWVAGDVIDIQIDRRTNLPIVSDFLPTKKEVEQHSERYIIRDYAMIVPSPEDASFQTNELDCSDVPEVGSKPSEEPLESIWFWSCLSLTVADPDNLNLSAPQKELL